MESPSNAVVANSVRPTTYCLLPTASPTRWILQMRGAKTPGLSPTVPYAFLHEWERGPEGLPLSTATVFLTNRECPFRCLMCDLWQNTLDETVPSGTIQTQIEYALNGLGAVAPIEQIKLYNAGSFWDKNAIPTQDLQTIAQTVRVIPTLKRVIVECHPRFVLSQLDRMRAFRDAIAPATLEVAMGLETVYPEVLAALNKQMTVPLFLQAADILSRERVALRAFLLVRPPFMSEEEGVHWAKRSLDVALTEAKAEVACVIPTRAGNGAMEALQSSGDWHPPTLASLEEATDYGVTLCQSRGQNQRVFADLWDLEKFYPCPDCGPKRKARLEKMNETGQVLSPIRCVCPSA